MTDRWLDLSRYQGAPNFDLIKTSGQVQGTIAQAGGYGSLADPQFVRNHAEAKRVGLVAGAYYFADPSQTSPAQQVDHFLSLAPSADFYATDYEIGAGDLTAWADTFQGLLASRTGKLPWAYTGSWFWTAHYHGHNLINYPLWLASYTAMEPAPPPPWTWVTAWQYTSSFACPGIAGGVDASWVYAAPPTTQGGLLMALSDAQQVEVYNWVKELHEAFFSNVPAGNFSLAQTYLDMLGQIATKQGAPAPGGNVTISGTFPVK